MATPKVLIIQEAGRHEENKNYRECLCLQRAMTHNGVESDVWGLGHENYYQQPYFNDYDLIINLENYDTTGWVPDLSSTSAIKFLWSIDPHVKGIESYLNTARDGHYDRILQAVPMFVQFGASVFFPNCYDDDLIVPKKTEKLYDFGFCGNINNRGPLVEQMKSVFDFKLDEFVIGDSMVEAINSYKAHWNCNIGVDINYRNFETMGCKTLLLTSFHPNYESLGFVHEKNCFMYGTQDEMISLGEHILLNGDYGQSVAENGYELVKKNHTFKNRAQLILEYYDALKRPRTEARYR